MTKIMLVEDDNNLREIYQARLAAEGFEIVSSSDGEAALAMAAKEKPDMIISDVMMPKISGFEMLDILRNTDGLKNVKVIMLTALGQAEDSARAESLGADRYLVKSQVTLEDIVKATHELLDDESGTAAAPANATPAQETTASVEPAPVEPAPVAASDPAADPDPAAQTSVAVEPVAIPVTVAAPPEPAAIGPDQTDTAVADEPDTAVPAQDVPAPVPEIATVNQSSETTLDPVQAPAEQAPEPVQPEPKPVTTIPVIEAPTDPVSPPAAESTVEPAAPESAPTQPEPAAPLDPNTSEAKVATSQPQSTASEENSIKEQIDNFIANQPDQVPVQAPADELDVPQETNPQVSETGQSFELLPSDPAASEPASAAETDVPAEPVQAEEMATYTSPVITNDTGQPADSPEAAPVTVTPPPAETSASSDIPAPFSSTPPAETPVDAVPAPEDTLLDDAAQDLAANAPEQPVAPPPVETPSINDLNSKRVIQPLSPVEKPDLNQLLEVEEAKNAAQQASVQPEGQPQTQPQPNVAAYQPPLSMPKQLDDIDPNSISL